MLTSTFKPSSYKSTHTSKLIPDHVKQRQAEKALKCDPIKLRNTSVQKLSSGKFQAELKAWSPVLFIGRYNTERLAKEEADKAMVVLLGDQAELYFPERTYDTSQMSDYVTKRLRQLESEKSHV